VKLLGRRVLVTGAACSADLRLTGSDSGFNYHFLELLDLFAHLLNDGRPALFKGGPSVPAARRPPAIFCLARSSSSGLRRSSLRRCGSFADGPLPRLLLRRIGLFLFLACRLPGQVSSGPRRPSRASFAGSRRRSLLRQLRISSVRDASLPLRSLFDRATPSRWSFFSYAAFRSTRLASTAILERSVSVWDSRPSGFLSLYRVLAALGLPGVGGFGSGSSRADRPQPAVQRGAPGTGDISSSAPRVPCSLRHPPSVNDFARGPL